MTIFSHLFLFVLLHETASANALVTSSLGNFNDRISRKPPLPLNCRATAFSLQTVRCENLEVTKILRHQLTFGG